MKNGVEYINVKKSTLRCVKMKKVLLKLDNLFQGNKELSEFRILRESTRAFVSTRNILFAIISGDNLNVFINENWEVLYDELRPAFEEAINAIFRDIVDKVVAKVPYNDIFPA